MSSPFVVAQLMIPADGLTFTGSVYMVPDWPRGLIHLVSNTLIRTYQTVKATQSPLRSVPLTGITIYAIPGLDVVTGDILILGEYGGRTVQNNMPVFRVNPVTGAVGNSDGAGSTFGFYPAGYFIPDSVVGVACAGVSYGIVKEVAEVALAHMSTPCDHAGHEHAIVSNNRNSRASLCVGASGGVATAYLLDANNPGVTSIKVYYVRVETGAETYDPTTWPATNPYITSGTMTTINMADINPTWTEIVGAAIGYDQTDGNVIVAVNNVTTIQSIAKINTTTGAVMWVNPTVLNGIPQLDGFHLTGGRIWLPGGSNVGTFAISTVLDTATGEATVTPMTGLSWNFRSFVADGDSLIVFRGSYTAGGADAPEAAPGTTSFTGYGLLWPITAPAPPSGLAIDDVMVRTIPVPPCQIFLDWSNDRAHSFGSPVGNDMGALGEYRTFVTWSRLGYARDRVYRLTWSCPRPTALQGAWIEADTSAKS